MPESFFSYNLSRPYPYGWFTWVVVIGGLAAMALFSVVNLAADGYNLITVFSLNPNATVAKTWWFQKKPWSLTSKLSTSCQPQDLTANSQLMTSHDGFVGAFVYTLGNISSISTSDNRLQATLPYLNNGLEDCSILSMVLTWMNGSGSGSADFISVDAPVLCNLIPEIGYSISLNPIISIFDYSYSATGNDVHLFSASYKAWIQGLIDAYSTYLENQLAISNWDQYRDMAQFFVHTHFENGGNIINPDSFLQWIQIIYRNNTEAAIYGSISQGAYSDTVSEALYTLLRVVSSGILIDLGQNSCSNLFAQPPLLVQFLQEHNTTASAGWFPLAPPPGANISAFYQNQGNPLPPIKPATFATRYLCQVPQRKSTDSLIISILVADLVFLQVLWKLFNWAVTSILERRNPAAKYCQGCAKELPEDYSPTNQTDPAAQVEAGKGLGMEVARDSSSCVAVDSRHESRTEDEPAQEPPGDEPTPEPPGDGPTQEPPVDEPTQKSPVDKPTQEPPAWAATA